MRSTRNRTWMAAAILLAGALTTGMVRGWDGGGGDDGRVLRGFQIAPMPLSLAGRDRALVGLGSYIVNAQGGCNDCHSTQEYATGGNPFMGQPKVIDTDAYLLGGQAFGPFVSRNLRPELPSGLPAGRTYGQFLEIIRHGIDYDAANPLMAPRLQVMPWPGYQDMTEGDIRAMYEYLSALPPAPAMP